MPRSIDETMFMDGVTYAAISPEYGRGDRVVLVAFLDTPVVENVCNLLIPAIHIGLIASIWKRLLPTSIDRLQGNKSVICIINHFIDKLFTFVDTRRFYLYL